MKNGSLFCVLMVCLGLSSCKVEPTIDELTATITELIRSMETAYNQGDLKKVAAFYRDDAYLLGPGGYQVHGRTAIDTYWTRLKNPIRWQLDTKAVATTEAALYETGFWKKMKNKPPHWSTHNIPLRPEEDLLFQLGHSTLEYEREDATHHISEVDFMIIWKKNEAGFYRIYVDSFVKNEIKN